MKKDESVVRRERNRNYFQERRARMRAEGKCTCGRPRKEGYKRCALCISTEQKRSKKRGALRRDEGVCQLCGKASEGKAKCESCRMVGINWLRRLKAEVIGAYGGCCSCCGEKNPAFLTIDHMNNDGSEHRRTIKTSRIYSWLKKRGYPKEGFQVLCFNCNCGRYVNGGICPHQE